MDDNQKFLRDQALLAQDEEHPFAEDFVDTGSAEDEILIQKLSDSLAAGERPNKKYFAHGLRGAAKFGLALQANVLEHLADLLENRVGHKKTKVCRQFPTIQQMFAKIEPQGPRCLRVATRYAELLASGRSQKEAYEILRNEFSAEFVHRGKDEPGVSDRALALDIQQGRRLLK